MALKPVRRWPLAALLVLAAGATVAAQEVNIALGRPVSASGPTWSGQVPENLTDGNYANQTHPLASSGTLGFWYEVDLEQEFHLDRIILFNRIGCCPERLSNYNVSVFKDSDGSLGARAWSANVRTDGSHSGDGGQDVLTGSLDPDGVFFGRFIRIINLSDAAYNPQIAELEVYAAPLPSIRLFGVDHGNITQSGNPDLPTSATLSWSVERFDALAIDEGIGPVAGPEGSTTVSPPVTTTYTLTATNASGSSTASVTVGVDEIAVDPAITEFMAANTSTLDDGEGDASDWVEIHNPNPFTVNLEGYYLTDDPGLLTKWKSPSASIPAGGYLIVFASGDDKIDAAGHPHASFQLSKEGEYLALVSPDGSTVLQQFPADYPSTLTFPVQADDLSYGIGSDGRTGFLSAPTPGAPNGPSFDGFVEDTQFTLDRGFYPAPVDIAITTPTPGAEIRYTTDGSEPTETRGKVYTATVHVSLTTVLRAAAFKSGFAPTNVGTQTYVFLDDVIASSVMNKAITQAPAYAPQMHASLTDLPTLSLVTEGTINDTTEVKASLELILPDGTTGFQIDAGVKYYGGAFTSFAKKNFRLYFRGAYGARKLKYPLFTGHDHAIPPVEIFDQIELRSCSHDMVERGFYMSNIFTDDTMLDMKNLNPHGRFVHLYLSGTYWGMYHLRERWNADMLAQYLGGDKEDYEAVCGNWNVGGWPDPGTPYDGDGSAWARIKSLRGDYEAVKPYLDVPHYIDYMLMFMFGNSEDEYRCVGPKEAGSGFKFFLNDADGFLRSAGNRTSMGMPGRQEGDGPGSIFSMLLHEGHPDYKTLLADRIHKHFFNDGAMTPAKNRARLLERCGEVERPFIAEAARWGYRTPATWATARDDCLSGVLPSRTATVVSQYRSAGLYPSLAAPTFNLHGGAVAAGFKVTMQAAAGAIYHTTGGGDPRLPGGAISPAALAWEGQGIRIERTTPVKARAKLNAQWSAVSEAVFALDSSSLRITECMYHPPDPLPGSPFSADDMEFIELQNTGERPLNLTGISVSSAVSFTFPDGDATPESDLQPGEVVLIVKNLEAFESAYGTSDIYIAGEYGGNLSNAGERIVLEDRIGRTLADFEFSDGWYSATDGGGASLEIVYPAGDPASWSDAGSWRPSKLEGGSPGVAPPLGTGGAQKPGDINQDGAIDIADAIALLLHLFVTPVTLPCGDGSLADEGNLLLLNINGDAGVNLTDAVGILNFLFLGGPAPSLGLDCVKIQGCPDICSR